jgi:hypothetical protein
VGKPGPWRFNSPHEHHFHLVRHRHWIYARVLPNTAIVMVLVEPGRSTRLLCDLCLKGSGFSGIRRMGRFTADVQSGIRLPKTSTGSRRTSRNWRPPDSMGEDRGGSGENRGGQIVETSRSFRVHWISSWIWELSAGELFMNLCRLVLAPFGLRRCKRSAICLTDRVVSCRNRAASASFAGWPFWGARADHLGSIAGGPILGRQSGRPGS